MYSFIKLFLFAVSANSCMVTMAYAYLTPTSLFAQNDGFLVRDSETGLDWLKLSETAGLSVNGVLGNSGGWIGRGFRYATTNEVVDLWSHAGIQQPDERVLQVDVASTQAVA